MKIEEIYNEFEKVINRFNQKAFLARAVAKKARKRNDLKKWDKFNSVARVYEMVAMDIMPLHSELYNKTPKVFKKIMEELPF